LVAGSICTVAGTGQAAWNGDGVATESTLYLPSAVGLAPTGALAIADYNNLRVRELRDGVLVTVAGDGDHDYATVGTAATDSGMENPVALAWDATSALLVAEEHASRVLRIVDGVIEAHAGTGEEGYLGDGGAAVDAWLGEPGGICVDDEDRTWIADTTNGAVRRVEGGVITTVINGLDAPRAIACAGVGAWVSESRGGRVLTLDGRTGEATTLAEGMAESWGLYVGENRVLLAESAANRVLEWDGDSWTPIAGTGDADSYGDGGDALSAAIQWPAGIAIDAEGNVYVAEMRGHRVRRIAR
jgi:sugar lactone lactonase YvrE